MTFHSLANLHEYLLAAFNQSSCGSAQMQGNLKARWVWIPVYVAYVALVIAAAATYWMAAPPTYEVSAIISVKPGLYGVETATLRADQNARSQVALLESEDVIRQTIGAIGAAELYPNQEARGNLMVVVRQIIAAVGAAELYPNQGADGYLTAEDRAYIAAKSKLAVRYEPQTDNIRLLIPAHQPASRGPFCAHPR